MPSARGGDHDSGVSRRMAGSFMTQMQDIKEPVFWCFTANSVDELHEAFLADDRVDSVVYVRIPGPAQRAACWRLYLSKFFPEQVNGKTFPGYQNLEFTELIEVLQNAKKVDAVAWANKLIPSLLCLHGEERQRALCEVASASEETAVQLEKLMIQDDGWTPARIKSVCRLARKRNLPLSRVAQMMPRTQRQLLKAINKLEKWATDEAVDAETGEAYEPARVDGEEDGSKPAPKAASGKVRRTVRRYKDE